MFPLKLLQPLADRFALSSTHGTKAMKMYCAEEAGIFLINLEVLYPILAGLRK